MKANVKTTNKTKAVKKVTKAKETKEMKKFKKARINDIARRERINKMLKIRDEYLAILNEGGKVQIVLQRGNTKTGVNCWTVSLIPVVDCYNCDKCMLECYDIDNDCYLTSVQNDRARNSALHMFDIAEYWRQVEELVRKNFVMQLRINVGGDLRYEDFGYVKAMAERCPQTDIMFFTKTYDDINRFLDETEFPSNVHPIISRWCGVECSNKHNLPESHVLYLNGETTAPEFGSKYCGGNCSECHFNKDGCWTLKNGESVIFHAH